MNRAALTLALAAAALILTSCASTPPTPNPTVDYAALVEERYGTCLTNLGADVDLVFAAIDDGGTQQLGIVTGVAEGTILTWTVGEGNTGDVLTFPDAPTSEILASVGC